MMLPEIPRIGHPVLDGIIQAVVSVGAVLFSLLIVWLKWGAPQWERLNAKVRSIKEQTNNSHETNLRDDLDKVFPFLFGGTFIEVNLHEFLRFSTGQRFPFLFGGAFNKTD